MTVCALLDAMEAIVAIPGAEIVQRPDIDAGRAAAADFNISDAEQLFEDVTRTAVTDLLRPFLALPRER